ncbi:MAG: hypothetical protein AAB355_02905 [Patescibacteria group bacterium]
MNNDFLKLAAGFTIFIILGVTGIALSSYASPYLDSIKASVIGAFK